MRRRHPAGAVLCLNLLLLLPGLALFPPAPRDAPDEPPRPAPTPPRLHLRWVRSEPPLKPAWPDQPRLAADAVYRPVVVGDLVLVASSRTDGVTAYDATTGAVRWRFTAEGPVRFAPAFWERKAYFVCDDGFLYCLDVRRGELLWKFRGAPSGRKVLGNGRLVSTWPARGAPVVVPEGEGGGATVYFAAGIWPFMGVFLHALDARTGAVRWTNGGEGARYLKQPHSADAFAGVAPQGTLAAVGDRLLVPSGRAAPACFDRHTGRLLHFLLNDNSKLGGGPDVVAGGRLYCNGGAAFDLKTGHYWGPVGGHVALDGDTLYSALRTEVRAFDLRKLPDRPPERKGKKPTFPGAWLPPAAGTATALPPVTALARDGRRLFLGTPGEVFALDLPLGKGPGSRCWLAKVEGTPAHLSATGGRLVVSTREGRLYAFGPESKEPPRRYGPERPPAGRGSSEDARRAARLLESAGVRAGYCVVWGSGDWLAELARQSDLHVIAVEPDPARARACRERLLAAGVYGERVSVLAGDADSVELPPYLCSFMVAEDSTEPSPAFLDKAFASLRPYGGVLSLPAGARSEVARWAAGAGAKVREARGRLLVCREGAPPGAGDWTHEHADPANTRVSRDRLVKAPLGLLWFGGPGHDGVLPRHGHGPQPQVVGGRLIVEGVDFLRALDLYTGRLLWQAPLPGVGKAYVSLLHQPGANAGGGNYVSTPEGIYVAYGKACLHLNPDTGKTVGRFTLPALPGEKESPVWRYVNVAGDYLLGGANPVSAQQGGWLTRSKARARPRAASSSKYLFVLDRRTGRLLWRAEARDGFRHNGVCVGNGRLYAIDRLSSDQPGWLGKAARRDVPARLVAFDLRTGREGWSKPEVFGTWLSYSEKHDVLVESGRSTRDTLLDEPKGMRAYRGDSGRVLWQNRRYHGPAMIYGEQILKHDDGRASTGSACELLTGRPVLRADPLTGRLEEWRWVRNYGCNTPLASEHLLTFRSGTAGYFDLAGDGGTGNLGGFRASCTNNLVVAGGVLAAPDYTRTCTCSYPNQTSLALVHVPEAESWTFYGKRAVRGPVRRVGINLGAPGNRKAPDGTLWLEHPPVGGPSPRLAVTTVPRTPDWFRMHSSQLKGEGPRWVAASGARGLRSLTVGLGAGRERAYTVRLYFVEPEGLGEGRRRFHVRVQGREVMHGLDVSKEAGGPNRTLVKEVRGVKVRDALTVTLTPDEGAEVPAPVLCGVEAVAEGW
jgi:outer membrane protein assembly factor BamB